MGIFKKIIDYFWEDVDENEPVEKTKIEKPEENKNPKVDFVNTVKETPVQPTTQQTEKVEPVETKAPEKEEVKPVVTPKKEPTFLNVTPNTTTETEVKKVIKPKKEEYRLQQVISPIFGSDKSNTYSVNTSNAIKESELETESVIGTVFSPIYGRELKKSEEVVDVVDEKIATMTTKDFITKKKPEIVNSELLKPVISINQAVKEAEERITENKKQEAPAKIEVVEEVVVETKEPEVITGQDISVLMEQEVIYPSEKEKSNNETFENLKLFN